MTLSQPTHEIRVLYDVKARMRDDVKLSNDVFLPRKPGRYPTILLRTPYETLHEPHIDWAVWWAKRGYAVVLQDCRGRFESEGTFYPYRDDGPDGHDTLEWISTQAWYDGKIGTSGRSYGGLFQWQLAPLGSPYLTAMAPQVIMGDYFGDCHRIGGAVQWALTGFATVIFSASVSLMQLGAKHIFGNSTYYRQLPLIDIDVETIGREVPWYRDWCTHTVYDDYWHALNTEARLGDVQVPVVQQAAWYDPYTASMLRTWSTLHERRDDQKIYVIPWTHHLPEGSQLGDLDFGHDAVVNLRHEDLRWFDYWLKGIDTGIMAEPPIRLFVMGENVWRNEHEWPLARTRSTPYYLHNQRSLTPEPPGKNEEPDRFDYDPNDPVPTLGGNNSTWTWMKFAAEPIYPGPLDQRPLEARDDVLVYTSPPLERELEVTGPLEMVLYAASSCVDTDFTAKLVDVYPDGRAIHLSEGILRARHRASLSSVDFLEPGEVSEFRIQMAPTSNLFHAGHALRVEISSSNFPRFDRNLNTGEDIFTSTRLQVARQTVLHDQRYASHLVVPIIPR